MWLFILQRLAHIKNSISPKSTQTISAGTPRFELGKTVLETAVITVSPRP